jgi:hypothetical protein
MSSPLPFEEPHMTYDAYLHIMQWQPGSDYCSACSIDEYKRGPMRVYLRRRITRTRERNSVLEHRHDHYGWHPMSRRHRLKPIVIPEVSSPSLNTETDKWNPEHLNLHPARWIIEGDKTKRNKKIPEGEASPLERYQGTHRTILGSSLPQKCRMCGGRPQCKLSTDFMDLCTPKPVPRGTLIIDGCAILISRGSSKTQAGQDSIFKNRRPTKASAIDIDETGRNVIMKVKVLKLWDTRSDKVAQAGLVGDETGNIKLTIWKKSYQPPISIGRCYHIHNAVTDFFGGSYQIQATDKTTITELKNETVRTKSEFIRSPALSMLRDGIDVPEAALKVPGIDEPKPTWEEYSAAPFISDLDDVELGDEESDIPPDIDPLDKGLKLKKALNSLYVRNPAKAKEIAARLTPAQWKSIDRIGGLSKDLAFGICKVWKEPEPEGRLRATEAGFAVITRKEKNAAIDAAQAKRQDKFMINHGFRIKDKLEDLMFCDPARAKAAAAKLTFYDWQALNYIGGLNTPMTGSAAGSR